MMFLYKPHVVGGEGQVTSPDVIVDCAFVDGTQVPVGMLTMEAWLDVAEGQGAKAAVAVMALGGGALVLPAVVLDDGRVSLGRMAQRMSASDVDAAAMVEAVGGEGDALPRGYLVVQTGAAGWASTVGTAEHRVHPHILGDDHWGGARPRPRYSVGPTQKDVTHYI